MSYPSRRDSSRTLNGQAAYAERLLDLVAPKLEMVEEELRRNFRSKITTIQDVGEHILGGGGKRLRPALLLLVSRMLRYDGFRDVVYGAVVEFIHTATLVHDDIIDEADVRRGRTSINYRWGNDLTVLVGDYLYAHSMAMALAEGNLDILRLLSDATIKMIEGRSSAPKNGRDDLSVDDYFDIAARRRRRSSRHLPHPGYLVDLRRATPRRFNYGYNLGVCFQLIDDLLDFTSSTESRHARCPTCGKESSPAAHPGRPHASKREREIITRVASRSLSTTPNPPRS